ncbi:MAG: sensor histidine kinase [Deltaproteobacteria bacterium]|nr:sensor histidine kinase [Deltaproteobacteria bacterium]
MNDHGPEEPRGLAALMRLFAHDLRNPLSALVTNLGFARRLVDKGEGEPDPELDEVLADSEGACEVLRLLVTNLEALARHGDLGGDELGAAPMQVLEEVAASCRSRARMAEVELAMEGAEAVGRVPVSRRALALILENLATNALQHAPRGSRVTLGMRRAPERVELVVIDRGGAIPEALREGATGFPSEGSSARDAKLRRGRGASLFVAKVVADANGLGLAIAGEGDRSELVVSLPCPRG